MKNVIISFGANPTYIDQNQTQGPYTTGELGNLWLDWCAELSPNCIRRYHLVVITPKKTVLPDSVNAWASLTRFDENSGINGWPQGPNAVFKQVQWYYYYKKLSGAFLWCEPDCIPLVPDWLDVLADEYMRSFKPFMGGLVDVRSLDGKTQVPRHMTGNAVYPEKAYEKAPALMEAINSPWDVHAADQILRQAHLTTKIQHLYRHPEIRSVEELRSVLHPDAVLFHSDKYGAIARLLSKRSVEAVPSGKTLMEVFAAEPPRREPTLDDFSLANILEYLRDQCHNQDIRKQVARFCVQHNIVNYGHVSAYLGKLKKEKALDALAESNP